MQSDSDSLQDDDLLDEQAACRFYGGTKPISPATLWRGVRDGRYARPIHVGPQIVRWVLSDLRRDRARMVAERDAPSK